MVTPLGSEPSRGVRVRPSILAATVVVVTLLAARFASSGDGGPDAEAILAASAANRPLGQLTITYPLEGTLFPPEIVAPTVRWTDRSEHVDSWFVVAQSQGGEAPRRYAVSESAWRPSEADWARIKERSVDSDATVVIVGVNHLAPAAIVSAASVRIRTSRDKVGDSIFYREVPLPFLSAVRDPSRIRWRFGGIDSQDAPPIVLQNLPVCGNCHSFSTDGRVLGLDVDYGNDKAAYAIVPVAKQMLLTDSNIITWADYRRNDGEQTFGLLSQVSPDGRHVVSTLKDRSVFVATPEITFSQLFFPIKGILVVYDRDAKSFQALPGADNPEFVQSNPTWSPDGRELMFARAKAYRAEGLTKSQNVLLDEKDVPEFVTERRPFRYDLYRIPYNEGRGGAAEPVEGASGDGKSNFFPKYSPDGKWMVFCKANSYMLLQPDSELYIAPAQGGVPRRLRANTPRMNSWHSWSSNSRWLVFSSKWNTPYTQLFLTHIDENGADTPPVLLERFTGSDRAANIPEFVKLAPDAIANIREQFLDPYSFLRAGEANERTGDYPGAERTFKRGLELDPRNADLHNALGWALFQQNQTADAIKEYEQALRANPRHAKAHDNLALAYVDQGDPTRAVQEYRASIELEPKAEIYSDLGFALDQLGRHGEALDAYKKALALDPKCGPAHVNLAVALLKNGEYAQAAEHYEQALQVKPNAETHNGLGYALEKQGKLEAAADEFRKAIQANSGFVPAYNNLGTVLLQQGKLDDAAAAYRDSLRQRPTAPTYNELAMVLAKQGKTDEAVNALREALHLDPTNAEARAKLRTLRASQGRVTDPREQ